MFVASNFRRYPAATFARRMHHVWSSLPCNAFKPPWPSEPRANWGHLHHQKLVMVGNLWPKIPKSRGINIYKIYACHYRNSPTSMGTRCGVLSVAFRWGRDENGTGEDCGAIPVTLVILLLRATATLLPNWQVPQQRHRTGIGTGECQSKIDRFGELSWCFCLCTGPDEWQLHSEDGYADVCVGGQGLMGAKLHRNAGMDSMGSRWMRMVEILPQFYQPWTVLEI